MKRKVNQFFAGPLLLPNSILKKLIMLQEQAQYLPGRILLDNEAVLDRQQRRCGSSSVLKLSNGKFLVDRLQKEIAKQFNFQEKIAFDYSLFASYKKGDFIKWHVDSQQSHNEKNGKRMFGCIILLTKKELFDGGELEFLVPGQGVVNPKLEKQGQCVIFPAGLQHQVTKIKSGHRQTLNVWFSKKI